MAATPIIPLNGSFKNPLPHCNVSQVKSLLLGQRSVLDQFRDDDGSLDPFWKSIETIFIPEATRKAVGIMRTNYDFTKEVWFFDGNGSDSIVLPRREIVYVNAVYLRVIPSLQWYRFVRPRKVDGSEFAAIGGIEPPPPAPESIPPGPITPQIVQQPSFTGIEDADLLVDPRRRMIKIPPRILYANMATPLWNYNFITGPLNVEVHFAYGFAPTAYTDGQPLKFDPDTGVMQLTSDAATDLPGGAPVDWSSGMPPDLTMAVARFVYADILRRAWRGISGGLASQNVDGASESYGNSPFGGSADTEEAAAIKALQPWTIRMN